MSRPSESPYARHGAIDATVDQRKRLYRLSGTEHVFWVAHATLGEWREWRRVAEENGIFDPLNLRGFADYEDDSEIVVPIEVDAEDGTTEDVNFSEDLGRYYDRAYQTPELEGTGYIEVTDLEGAGYTVGVDFSLAFKAPGEAAYGAAVEFQITDLQDPGGDPARYVVHMLSDSQQYAVSLGFDIDTFLVFWFLREIPILFTPLEAIDRDYLAVPTLELPRGRGEA